VLKKAQEVVASGDVRAIVDFGIELDRTIKAESQELEEIKRVLREVGETTLADRRTEKTVQVEGHLGVVTVTYPADAPKLKAGVDLAASEAGIPEDVFKTLFRGGLPGQTTAARPRGSADDPRPHRRSEKHPTHRLAEVALYLGKNDAAYAQETMG
jgi:hypothetical protein